jgi:hypothetical protein
MFKKVNSVFKIPKNIDFYRAKSCIAAGDKKKAIRLVEKSLRLFETEHGKFLLDKAKNMSVSREI